MNRTKARAVAVLVAILATLASLVATQTAAYADYTYNTDYWESTGGRSNERTEGDWRCWEQEEAQIIVVHFVRERDDGSTLDIVVDQYPSGATRTVTRCEPIENISDTYTVEEWYFAGAWYSHSSGYYDYCRCWADYYSVAYDGYLVTYQNGAVISMQYLWTNWSMEEYWNYD